MKLSPSDIIEQKYQIVRMLGTGGMGSVYEATNLRVGRRVAIKVMHKVRDQQDIARFEREARAAQIGSPYIVQVHDLGYLEDGAPYMVMEYLSGESLGERIHRVGRMRPSELMPIAKQGLEALAAAHKAGIVHRDLKPDNVFLARPEGEEREIVKLVDFGISKFIDSTKQASELSLTRTGTAVGTPHYMSPEQVQGAKDLDGRSDLYSLGVMIYRCLGGQLPFNSDDVAPLLVQILVDVPRPLRELAPELDRELIALVMRAMARRAEDRFQTASDFLGALQTWEKSHAADLDAPLVPAGMTAATRTAGLGTAASWESASVANAVAERSGLGLSTVLMTSALSIAGVVGLLVAIKIWREPAIPAPAASSSSSPSSLSTAGPAGPVLVQDNRAPQPPLGTTTAPALAAAPHPAGANAFAPVRRPGEAPSTPMLPDLSPRSAPVAVTSASVPSTTVAPAQPVASVQPPAPLKPSAAAAPEQSNRHVLGDL